MNDKQIARLLQGVAEGDDNSLGTLYEKTKRGVFAFVYPYFNSYADAEDCVEDVFLKITKYAYTFKPTGSARGWILQIAKNTALDQTERRQKIVFTEKVPERSEPERDFTVFDALNSVLTEDERYVVVAHVLWGYKHKEIAELLRCPIGTITSKYKRAITKLQDALKEEE